MEKKEGVKRTRIDSQGEFNGLVEMKEVKKTRKEIKREVDNLDSSASTQLDEVTYPANISETSVPLQHVDEAPCPDQTGPRKTSGVDDSTLRGLASGEVDPRLKDKKPCVIFGDSLPSWIAFVSQLGYFPVLVVLRSDEFLTEVEASVPEACTILVVPNWDALVAKVPHFKDRAAISFVDGRVTQQVLDLSDIMDIDVVVGTGSSRRWPRGWNQVVHKASHFESGGVTHTTVHVVACARARTDGDFKIPTPTIPTYVARDVGSVLTDVVSSGVPRRRPKQVKLSAGAVVNVRPMGQVPVYHGKGWLPPDPTPGTVVISPSVYAPRDHWFIRRISSEEFLTIHDCPVRLLPVLAPLVRLKSFPGFSPGKALLSGACAALSELATLATSSVLLGNGGGVLPSPAKRKASGSPAMLSKTSATSLAMSPATSLAMSPKKSRKNEDDESSTKASIHHPELTAEQQAILQQVDQDKRERKATKADDAKVPVYVWTNHYVEDSDLNWDDCDKSVLEKAMDTMRKFLVLRWKRKVFYSYLEWFYETGNRPRGSSGSEWLVIDQQGKFQWSMYGREQYQEWHRNRMESHSMEIVPGSDAVVRAWNSSWWEWEDGSRPFHWRWPKWYRSTIRDGLKVHLDGEPPAYLKPQRDVRDPKVKEAVKKKLNKVRVRRYIGKGIVVSLTSFFPVPKGENDIRMVYDGTKSGLNEIMWVPRFGLPTIETHLRSIEEGTFMADVDVGDCFLNFPLHRSLQRLAGVDLTHYFPDPSGAKVWECWQRALMGCKSSPYQAVQGMSVAEEVIRGRPDDSANVFQWDHVRLNCPGDPEYNPSVPWVSKVRKDGRIAADLVIYVDDLRTSGMNRKEAWRAARRTASMLNHLGLQDAPRKRRDSTQTPGAWSGSVVVTRDDGVYVTSDSEKWNKAKNMVDEVLGLIREDPKKLERKRLEQVRGFLNYVVRTYPPLKPYLTGLHLTIDGWRPNRDKDGWRVKKKKVEQEDESGIENWDWTEYNEQGLYEGSTEEPEVVPVIVEAKERLGQDMVALKYLMAHPKPLPRRVRSAAGKKVVYCFGDASSSGFGFTLEIDGHVYYQYGQWNSEGEDKSSNWREAKNLLDSLRRAVQDHQLHGLELFIFTDNTTAESTFWKGWSKDSLLSGIVLEMRKLEMEHDLILHIIHVSGSRMINQGTDGLSRADHSNGVMNGDTMTQHIPLNLTAFQRSPALLKRFETHFTELKLQLLEPRDWFDEQHKFGNFVWAPPPAAADAVVDLLNKARHKRPESFHIVLVPRLMTGRWRRMLTRTADFYFRIDWNDSWNLGSGRSCWTTWIDYCCNPNCQKRVNVRTGIFCGNYSFARGPFAPCQQVFCPDCFVPLGDKPFKIRETLDDDGVPLLDKEENRFLRARAGDMFMTPFQCETCHFRNIQMRDPFPHHPRDDEILEFMRRANLDAFWARESSTVNKNLNLLMRGQACFDRLELNSGTHQLGPFPLHDSFGMLTAIAVLDKSLDKGKYEELVQWETFRKMRSALTNFHQASARGLQDVIGAYERRHLWISAVPTHSFWFTCFMDGLHKRVGEVVRQDWPIPIEVVQYIDRSLNRLWRDADDEVSRKKIAEMGAWFVVQFCVGLRGEEMLLIELRGTADSLIFLENQEEPHFLVRIKGRTKTYLISGKGFEIPCVAVTGVSGLRPGRWMKRLVDIIQGEGRRHGKLFQRRLAIPRLLEYEEDFFDILESVQSSTSLIGDKIDLREEAGIGRTIRRGLTSHSINMQIDETLLRAVNRWRSEFKPDGSHAHTYNLVHHYAKLDTLKPTFLRFSKAL